MNNQLESNKIKGNSHISNNIFWYYGFFCAVLIYLSVFLHSGKNYFRNLNLMHQDYKLKNTYDIIPEIPEPYLNAIWSNLNSNDFFTEKIISDEQVTSFLTDHPELNLNSEEIKFNSELDLYLYLRSRALFDAEYDAMKYMLEKKDKYASNWEIINYLHECLYKPLIYSLDSCQLGKAQWLATQLRSRLMLLDTEPLDNERESEITQYNVMLLTILIFETIKDVHGRPTVAQQYIPVLKNGNWSLSDSIIAFQDTTVFVNLKKYWQALHVFRQHNYINASQLFSQLNSPKNEGLLKELSALMEIRCWFWGVEKEMVVYDEKCVNKIKEIGQGISKPSFRSDVITYLNMLYAKNNHLSPDQFVTPVEYPSRNQTSLSLRDEIRLSQQDIIDALIDILLIKKKMGYGYGGGEPYYTEPKKIQNYTQKSYSSKPHSQETNAPQPYNAPPLRPKSNKLQPITPSISPSHQNKN